MPIAAALPAIIAGVGASALGGIAGATNARPPSLDTTQRGALDSLIQNLLPTAQGPASIDPVQRALLYGNIAQSQTGGMDAVTHALVSRGLGRSGLLGGALTQVANTAQQGRNQADLGLQQQAIQQKQLSIQDILGLLGVGNTPGQSGIGAFTSGMAPIAAYSIMSAINNRNNNNQVPNSVPTVAGNPGDTTVGALWPSLPNG